MLLFMICETSGYSIFQKILRHTDSFLNFVVISKIKCVTQIFF